MVDPMLLTGGSASAAIDFIKQRENIKFVCPIAAPEESKSLTSDHPDVDILVSVDEYLNEHDILYLFRCRRQAIWYLAKGW